MNISRVCLQISMISVLVSLSGCGDGEEQEVRQWMEDVRRQTPVTVQKISEPKKFTPFVYERKNEIDPFSPVKLSAALAKLDAAKSNSALKPDLDRRKEPLEEFPLDAIKMVGTLEKPGLSYALLQADKSVFQVKVGNYIGQNFGMVTKITDTEVELREIVRDAAGDWVERKAKLELQESAK
jgi:type IV pilus assembly protein PilP